MRKRILTPLALALTFSLLTAGCGSQSTSETPSDTSAVVTSTNDSENTDSEKKESSDEKEVGIEPITVVDNEECRIEITELEPDNIWGYSVKATLENKSKDVTYMFAIDQAAINNVSTDPVWASEVAPGKKSNETISFTDSYLTENNIGDVSDIELTFRVYDTDNWDADPVAKETVHVYPKGEENAAKFVREDQDGDNVLVDNDQVKVVVIDTGVDEIWGYTVKLYIENKTDKTAMVAVDESSVNGFMEDPFWATTVGAGQVRFSNIYWSNEALENDGISKVEEVEFKLRAYDDNDYEKEYVNDTFTIKEK